MKAAEATIASSRHRQRNMVELERSQSSTRPTSQSVLVEERSQEQREGLSLGPRENHSVGKHIFQLVYLYAPSDFARFKQTRQDGHPRGALAPQEGAAIDPSRAPICERQRDSQQVQVQTHSSTQATDPDAASTAPSSAIVSSATAATATAASASAASTGHRESSGFEAHLTGR